MSLTSKALWRPAYLLIPLLVCAIGIESQGLAPSPSQANAQLGLEIKRFKQRQIFLAARHEARSGKLSRVNTMVEALGDYPLTAYITFEALLARPHSKDEVVMAFIADHPEYPISSRLRGAFTDYRREQNRPTSFLRFFNTDETDPDNLCYHAYALWQTDDQPAAMAATEALWLTGASQPRLCDKPFRAWRKNGGLTPSLAWQRYELAMLAGESRLAQYLERYLSEPQQKLAARFKKLIKRSSSAEHFDTINFNDPSHQKLADMALSRLVNQDPINAANVIRRLIKSKQLDQESGDQYLISAAVKGLRKTDFELADLALPARLLNHPDLVEAALGQQIKANEIAGLSPWLDRIDPRKVSLKWQYWRARALTASAQDVGDAAQLFKALAEHRDFYGYLSAQWLKQPGSLVDKSTQITPTQILDLAAAPAVQRTYELRALGALTDARREWLNLVSQFSHTELRIASALAARWHWHDMAIQAHAAAESWDEVNERFPTAFAELFNHAALTYGVPEHLAIGVARRESAFWTEARSPVGALGLMQIMPKTAEIVAGKLGLDPPSPERLTEPEFNIRLGTAYLGQLLQEFDGNRVLALAAYNAGPSRARAWQKNKLPVDAWIESIPFRETRAYVKAVLLYSAIYSQRSGLAEPLLYPYEIEQFGAPKASFFADSNRQAQALGLSWN